MRDLTSDPRNGRISNPELNSARTRVSRDETQLVTRLARLFPLRKRGVGGAGSTRLKSDIMAIVNSVNKQLYYPLSDHISSLAIFLLSIQIVRGKQLSRSSVLSL